MFLGLRTAIYVVDDIERAKEWYTKVLSREPYFDEPFYVGFDVGGYELGLLPEDNASSSGQVKVYWGVEDIEASLEHLAGSGAGPGDEVQDVGEGIKTATVEDPFGCVFGIIENPHFALR